MELNLGALIHSKGFKVGSALGGVGAAGVIAGCAEFPTGPHDIGTATGHGIAYKRVNEGPQRQTCHVQSHGVLRNPDGTSSSYNADTQYGCVRDHVVEKRRP